MPRKKTKYTVYQVQERSEPVLNTNQWDGWGVWSQDDTLEVAKVKFKECKKRRSNDARYHKMRFQVRIEKMTFEVITQSKTLTP